MECDYKMCEAATQTCSNAKFAARFAVPQMSRLPSAKPSPVLTRALSTACARGQFRKIFPTFGRQISETIMKGRNAQTPFYENKIHFTIRLLLPPYFDRSAFS